MTYNFLFSKKANKQLRKLDPYVRQMILHIIKNDFSDMTNPRAKGKALSGDLNGLWRYRIGQYRMICDIRNSELIVLALEIGHRKDIYTKG